MKPRVGESRDDYLARRREYMREWRHRPENEGRLREYQREYMRWYSQTPAAQRYRIEYEQHPANKDRRRARNREWMRAYYHSPEGEAQRSDPEHRARHAKHQRDYARRSLVTAAGLSLNRKTDPPALIAVAELIRETKRLLKEETE